MKSREDSIPSFLPTSSTEQQFSSWLKTNKPFSNDILNSYICDFMSEWLLNDASQLRNTANETPYETPMCYLFDCCLLNCPTTVYSTLLTNISLISSDYSIMRIFLQRLPAKYFQKQLKTIIKHISKIVLEATISPLNTSKTSGMSYHS